MPYDSEPAEWTVGRLRHIKNLPDALFAYLKARRGRYICGRCKHDVEETLTAIAEAWAERQKPPEKAAE